MSDGKLSYEVEFEAKGLDQVQAQAARMKDAIATGGAGGAGGDALDLLKSEWAEQLDDIHERLARVRDMQQEVNQAAAMPISGGKLFAGIVAGAIAANESLEKLRRTIIDSAAETDRLSLRGARMGEDLREKISGLDSNADRDALTKDLTRELEDRRVELEALAEKINGGSLLTRGMQGYGMLFREVTRGDARSDEVKDYERLFTEYRMLESNLRIARGRDIRPDFSGPNARVTEAEQAFDYGNAFIDADTEGRLDLVRDKLEDIQRLRTDLVRDYNTNLMEQDLEDAEALSREIQQITQQILALRNQESGLQERLDREVDDAQKKDREDFLKRNTLADSGRMRFPQVDNLARVGLIVGEGVRGSGSGREVAMDRMAMLQQLSLVELRNLVRLAAEGGFHDT